MNRDLLKKAIKKLVLQEITNNQFGTPDVRGDEKAAKAAEKAVDEDGKVVNAPGTGKVVGDSPKHTFALSKQSDDNYDVMSIANGSERKTAKGLKLEDAVKFAKDHAEECEKSYVEKARAKSVNGGKEIKKEEDKKEVAGGNKVSNTDQMEDAEEETQIDIADDATTKADEKSDKELTAVDDDNSFQMGGELVDKIEKIIDRVLKSKDKVEPKTAHLKADSKMESPDKLTVKTKETPALKEKKIVSEVYGSQKLDDIDIINGETIIAIEGNVKDKSLRLKCKSGNYYDIDVDDDGPQNDSDAYISEINMDKVIGRQIVDARHDGKSREGVTLKFMTKQLQLGTIEIQHDHNGYYGFSYHVTKGTP